MYEDLKQELKRTGLTLRVLAQKIIGHDRSMLPPDALNAMMSECDLHQIQDHFPILLEFIQTLDDACGTIQDGTSRFRGDRRIQITAEMREYISKHYKDTGISVAVVKRAMFPELQPKVLSHTITRTLSGELKTIREGIWNGLKAYADEIQPVTLPKISPRPSTHDSKQNDPAPRQKRKGKAEIPFQEGKPKAVYVPHIPETTESGRTLADSYHEGLTPDLTEKTLTTQNPRPDAEHHRVTKRLLNMGYVALDDETYQRLHDERRRTRVSVRRLIRGSPDSPASLKVPTAEQWFNGSTLSAEKDLLDWVLNAYASLPSAPSSEN